MRKLTIESLQFTFKGGSWNIKPMIKFRKVSFKQGKKSISEFYGELVEFENKGIWLMLPAQEVVSFGYPNKKKMNDTYEQLALDAEGNLIWKEESVFDYRKARIVAASDGVEIKKADYFMGKCPVLFKTPLKLQGNTALLVQWDIVE